MWCLPQHAHKEMDADFAMSIAAALAAASETAENAEQERWQARLDFLSKMFPDVVDGGFGNESGDPLDFTEQEVRQALAAAVQQEKERAACVCDNLAGDWLQAEESARKASVPGAVFTYGTKADAAKKCAAAIRGEASE